MNKPGPDISEVHSLVASIRVRSYLSFLIETSALVLMAFAATFALAIVIRKLTYTLIVDEWTLASWMLMAFALVSIAVSMVGIPTKMNSAMKADEALGKKDRFSSLMYFQNPTNPFEKAFYEEAIAHVRSARASGVVPLKAPRQWMIAPFVCLAAMMPMFLPQYDIFGFLEDEKEKEAEELRIENTVSSLLKVENVESKYQDELERGELPELASAISEIEELRAKMEAEGATREEVQREIQNLAERLNQKSEALAERHEQLSRALERSASSDPTSDLKEAIMSGDPEKIQDALDDLRERLTNENMSAEERQEMLERTSESMSELSNELSTLSETMQMSLESGEHSEMSESEQNQLEQQSQQLSQMSEAMQRLSETMRQLSESMCQNPGNQQGSDSQNPGAQNSQGQQPRQLTDQEIQQLQNMLNQLSQLSDEELQQLMQQLQNMQNCSGQQAGEIQQLSNQLGLAPYMLRGNLKPDDLKPGDNNYNPYNNGGRGSGLRNSQVTDEEYQHEFVRPETYNTGRGLRTLIPSDLEALPSEGATSLAPGSRAAETFQTQDDALDEQNIPRDYHDAIRRYFGER
ncbi:MAG: hypothetical protein NUW37_08415 [Planctomycetes bacterium]|nr:hypothetical protein [Planctomycetota bacterium]